MEKPQWHPGTLLETSGYFWKTCTLHAGVSLDVFTALGGNERTAEQVAESIDADPRATGMLLNALSAMDLLVKSGKTYANTPESARWLSKASPEYIGFMIMHHYHLVDSWSNLDQGVRTGRPVRTRASFTDEARRESFLMGMFNIAMAIAPTVSKIIDLEDRRTLLDLGGGPGTYAIHFCLENPRLRATVYDLPTTRPFAEKTIERFGVSDRVAFMDGDFIEEPVPGEYDAAWLSHILHGEGPEDCRKIIEKAVSALTPGGLIMIHEFILEDTLDRPLFPALFSLNMLLGTESGQAYSESHLTEMLSSAGVVDIHRLPFRGPTDSSILMGRLR